MQKIIPHLWFDAQAEEAASLYTSCFSGSVIGRKTYYGSTGFEIHGQPEGTLMTVECTLAGQSFILLNGGPVFSFNPSVSFLVACSSKEEVDTLWQQLSGDKPPLMALGEYPFSPWYGWTTDKFGLSWQIMHMGEREIKQKITPTLMFVGNNCGKAGEAMNMYASIFHNTHMGSVMYYGEGEEPNIAGTIKHAGFTLEGQQFAAMDSAYEHAFSFNEAVSFFISCGTQEEIDFYWDKLSSGSAAQQCGWLKDKFGLSWQVAPAILQDMLQDGDKEKVARVTAAFLHMKKFNIEQLQQAFDGQA